MKKRNMIAALLCSACLVAGSVNPVFADATKVVTLGADLSDAQKQTMMKYFNVSADQVQILTVTNQDEHNHLDNIAPQEQIGSHTLSCAYVKPTQSGGIKVRTANLNWVTGNMIATSLSTSGVKNCEVIAACPMEVSGTGALTGIQMAYEKASGEKLDATKTKLANQEIVTTGELADKVGKDQATTVVNQSKMDVIQNDVQNADEIQNIVINVANQNNISVSQDDIDKIVSLLQQIAQQGYNYDDVKQTLEQVDANTTGASTTSAAETEDSMDEENPDDTVDVDQSTEDDDDIMNNVNSDVLGDNVIESSTEENDQEEAPAEDSADSSETEIPDATEDGTYTEEDSTEDTAEGTSADETGIPEATEENTDSSEESSDQSETSGAEADASQIDTSVLSEENKTYYDKFELFVKGEYEGDADALLAATENTEAVATVTLDQQIAKSVAETVEKQYYDILKDGTGSYVADGTETYLTPELNMMDQNLKKLFGIEITEENSDTTDEAAALLADVTEEDKQTLYKETMKYLAGLYGENTDTSEEESAQ
ncbi:DUF1002 domain-containing protein [Ruminococcus sp. AM36-2AA]|nr:DUF1002 domain-containing protein [Ruminococcus sp. AM41-10BH]RGH54063.1 DUF1002 domain-containing protein [Ruminococcus sp. AM36-5]RGH61250.1 DUF1002 domain-containing protein [Ruminococcus sp. AM36-2AA]